MMHKIYIGHSEVNVKKNFSYLCRREITKTLIYIDFPVLAKSHPNTLEKYT